MRGRIKRLAQYLFITGFSLVLSLKITGCSSDSSEIPMTITPSYSLTSTISPSANPSLTNTPEPTITPTRHNTVIPINSVRPTLANTPYPTLSEHGPYLAYLKNNSIILLNSDGKGRRVIDFAENGYISSLETALSPDKKWIVIYQGKRSIYGGLEITPELSINLLYIPDETIYRIMNLFPENSGNLRNEGDYGLFMQYEWSPDGRNLAFAGAMDGHISDLYVYDIETKAIRRLTNNTVSIWLINWSPDSRWIWFESIEPIASGDLASFYIIQYDESYTYKPTLLFKKIWTQGYWISKNLYFLYTTSDGGDCGLSHFRFYNILNREETILWRNPSNSFALDEDNQLLAISTECGERGTFVVDWYGKMYGKISDTPLQLEPWVGEEFSFLGIDYSEKQVFGIDHYGSMTHLRDKYFTSASESPDHRWYVLYQNKLYYPSGTEGMDLFSENNQYIQTITKDYVSSIYWNPDSTGLFYLTRNLYYIAIPDGKPVLLDMRVLKNRFIFALLAKI